MSELEENYLASISGLATPVREYVFARPRRWRFDFAWPDSMVAVEVEGGIFLGRGHTGGTHFESDSRKYNTANFLGWTILRFTDRMIKSGEAAKLTEKVLIVYRPRPGVTEDIRYLQAGAAIAAFYEKIVPPTKKRTKARLSAKDSGKRSTNSDGPSQIDGATRRGDEEGGVRSPSQGASGDLDRVSGVQTGDELRGV